jgi:hypothetical protein
MIELWDIQVLADGTGMVEHRAAPRFRALWITGLEGLAGIDGLCWSDKSRSEEDALTLYAFRWDGAVPDQAAFEGLMAEAVAAIDAWIASRL